jgi:hypothetical protein
MEKKLSKKFVPIPNTNYTINEYCEIRNIRSKIILHPFLISDYPAVNISVNGKRKTMYCHHLMSLTFLNHTPKRGLITINHIDQNKQNNRLDNLEIISHRRNSALTYISRNRELPTGVTKTNIGIRRFKCQISYLGINRYLGCYMTAQEASEVYIAASDAIVKTGNLPEHFLTRERYERFKKDQ